MRVGKCKYETNISFMKENWERLLNLLSFAWVREQVNSFTRSVPIVNALVMATCYFAGWLFQYKFQACNVDIHSGGQVRVCVLQDTV
jgi:hypothetical protein